MTDEFNGLASLARKKAAIMQDLKKLKKDKRNTQQNYNYASAEGVFDTIRALMVEHGLVLFTSAVSGSQEHFTSSKGTAGLHTTVQYRMLWIDAETGATVEDLWLSEGDDYQDKGYSKCATLALKYYLMTTFIVSSGDAADDPDAGLRERGTRQASQNPPKQAATPSNSNAIPKPRVDTAETAQTAFSAPSGVNWWTDRDAIAHVKESIGGAPGVALSKMGRTFPEFATADDFITAYREYANPVQNQVATPHTAPTHTEDLLTSELLEIAHVEPRMATGRTLVKQWIGHAKFEDEHGITHPIQVLLFAEDRRQLKALGYDVSGWDDVIGQNYPNGITVTIYKDTVGRKLAMAWSDTANALVAIERAR